MSNKEFVKNLLKDCKAIYRVHGLLKAVQFWRAQTGESLKDSKANVETIVGIKRDVLTGAVIDDFVKAENIQKQEIFKTLNSLTIIEAREMEEKLRLDMSSNYICLAFIENKNEPGSFGLYSHEGLTVDDIQSGNLNDSYDGYVTTDGYVNIIQPEQRFEVRQGKIVIKKEKIKNVEIVSVEAITERIQDAEIIHGTKGNYVLYDDTEYYIIAETERYEYAIEPHSAPKKTLVHSLIETVRYTEEKEVRVEFSFDYKNNIYKKITK